MRPFQVIPNISGWQVCLHAAGGVSWGRAVDCAAGHVSVRSWKPPAAFRSLSVELFFGITLAWRGSESWLRLKTWERLWSFFFAFLDIVIYCSVFTLSVFPSCFCTESPVCPPQTKVCHISSLDLCLTNQELFRWAQSQVLYWLRLRGVRLPPHYGRRLQRPETWKPSAGRWGLC